MKQQLVSEFYNDAHSLLNFKTKKAMFANELKQDMNIINTAPYEYR